LRLHTLKAIPNSIENSSASASGATNTASNNDPNVSTATATGNINSGNLNAISVADTTTIRSEVTVKDAGNFGRTTQPSVAHGIKDYTEHTIKDFLARPRVIHRATMNTNQTVNSYLMPEYRVPSRLYQQGMWFDKMKGFYAVKGTAKFRIQVNANRFQAGRILVYYVPCPGMRHDGKLAGDIYNTTQLPKVELDIAVDSEATITIPFNAPFSHSLMVRPGHPHDQRDEYDWAAILMQVYHPLIDPQGGSVDITVWASLEDVELMMPASTQSLRHSVKVKRRNKVRFNPEEVEQDDDDPEHMISNTLSTISKASGTLSKIPLVSSVAGPVSWATGILANTAEAFGFCKPFDHNHTVVKQSVMHNNLNFNGNLSGHVAALDSTNKLQHLDYNAGTNVDEMAFEHLLTKSSYLKTINWTTSQNPNAEVTRLLCSPDPMHHPGTFRNTTHSTIIRGPVVMHMAQQFNYFRGGFRFKLKFVKTEFHSGRLEIAFNPVGRISDGQPLSNWDAAMMHRDIVDIRGLSEYEFDVPYVSVFPYLKREDSFGLVVIRVVNKLVAPDTVGQTVPIIIEMSALPGFELAVPTNNWIWNSNTAVTFGDITPVITQSQSDYFTPPPNMEIVTYAHAKTQGGETGLDPVPIADATVSDPLGLQEHNVNDLGPAMSCIGERITSIRQLIKRPTNIGYRDFSSFFTNGTNIWVDDNTNPASYSDLPTGENQYPLLNYFSNWFWFKRGATILRITPIDPGVFSFWYGIIATKEGPGDTYPTLSAVKNGATRVSVNGLSSVERVDLSGSLDIRVPYYGILPYTTTDNTKDSKTIPRWHNRIVMGARTRTPEEHHRVNLYRCAADDYSLSFFTGTGYTVVSSDAVCYDKCGPETQSSSTNYITGDVTVTNQLPLPVFVSNTAVPVEAPGGLAVSQSGDWNTNITNSQVPVRVAQVGTVPTTTTLPVNLNAVTTTSNVNANVTNTQVPVRIAQVGTIPTGTTIPISINAVNTSASLNTNVGNAVSANITGTVNTNIASVGGNTVTNAVPISASSPLSVQTVGSNVCNVNVARVNGHNVPGNVLPTDTGSRMVTITHDPVQNATTAQTVLPIALYGPSEDPSTFSTITPLTVRRTTFGDYQLKSAIPTYN